MYNKPNEPKGTVTRKIGTLDIKAHDIVRVVMDALIDNGYDITTEPIFNDQRIMIGDSITVYRTELPRGNR